MRSRDHLESLGASVPADSTDLHLIDAGTICALALHARPVGSNEEILPDYCRRPDAELALAGRTARGSGAG